MHNYTVKHREGERTRMDFTSCQLYRSARVPKPSRDQGQDERCVSHRISRGGKRNIFAERRRIICKRSSEEPRKINEGVNFFFFFLLTYASARFNMRRRRWWFSAFLPPPSFSPRSQSRQRNVTSDGDEVTRTSFTLRFAPSVA